MREHEPYAVFAVSKRKLLLIISERINPIGIIPCAFAVAYILKGTGKDTVDNNIKSKVTPYFVNWLCMYVQSQKTSVCFQNQLYTGAGVHIGIIDYVYFLIVKPVKVIHSVPESNACGTGRNLTQPVNVQFQF